MEFLTMVARALNNENGQSVLEFLFMLPLMLGLVVILVKVNSAIQIGIVNQQYARGRALFLTFNSPFYPEVNQRITLAARQANQFVIGVSEEVAPESGDFQPSAPTQLVTRSKRGGGADAPGEEPPFRSKVRIRGTVTLCTANWIISTAEGLKPALRLGAAPPFAPAGQYLLSNSTIPNNICGSPMAYE